MNYSSLESFGDGLRIGCACPGDRENSIRWLSYRNRCGLEAPRSISGPRPSWPQRARKREEAPICSSVGDHAKAFGLRMLVRSMKRIEPVESLTVLVHGHTGQLTASGLKRSLDDLKTIRDDSCELVPPSCGFVSKNSFRSFSKLCSHPDVVCRE